MKKMDSMADRVIKANLDIDGSDNEENYSEPEDDNAQEIPTPRMQANEEALMLDDQREYIQEGDDNKELLNQF